MIAAQASVRSRLKERLLGVMDRKHHGAFVHLTRPGLSREQLACHFRHEFHTYVRDFPVLLARVLGQGPPDAVRAALAENIFEEQTGKLSLGKPHPELFLEMMDGLGFDRATITSAVPPLEPEATAYRAVLDDASRGSRWVIGAAVLTIFVEGSVHERAELEGRRELPEVEEQVRQHPMVSYYGCPPERMLLVRAHRMVERGHRLDAWSSVLDNVATEPEADEVVGAVEGALLGWLRYRDAVARAMGVEVLG
jgi:pyrroloquinoline-quinone synthase